MTPKINVAIIAGQLVVGGAERQLFLWLSNLDREKFSPIVVTLHPDYGDYWEAPIEGLGIPLLRIRHRRFRLARLLDIIKALRPYNPSLIHGWHLFASPYAGITAKLLGAKSLGGVRGNFRAFKSNFIESQLTLLFADALLVNSKSTFRQLKNTKKKIYVVQNAVETIKKERQDARAELARLFGLPISLPWIGSLGRLEQGKRFDLLLRMVANFHKEEKNFHFILIGDGPEKASLQILAESLGIIEHVTFTGEIYGASEYLKAFDIFCFASIDEGLPNVVMEAAMAGLPIVSWRVPFMEELLENGEMAFLVDQENHVAFKNALTKLIDSPTLRDSLGRSAQEHMLKNFSVGRFVERMTGIYEEILNDQYDEGARNHDSCLS